MHETRRILSHLMFHFVLTFSICMTIKLGWAWQKVGTFLKFANDRNRNILFSEFYKDYFFSRSFRLIRAPESCVHNIVRALHCIEI